MNALNNFLFGVYPYIALTIFFLGSLIRFDRDQYTWKSDSSQLLKVGQLRWGSNLFHIGVLFLFFGHTVGMLTPHAVYEHFISAGNKQLMAMISGGLAGLLGFIGVSLLLHRRLSEPRIRINSKTSDIVLLVLAVAATGAGLGHRAAVGPASGRQHDDEAGRLGAAHRHPAARCAVDLLAEAGWLFKLHMFLGMTIFVVFPFTRLVHVWSGFASVAYLFRPYQLVRARRLNVPAGQTLPPRADARV
jgi:nitrate reductase gamma subunit